MSKKRNILILGASYGSLLGTKLAMAGHDVKLVCLPAEAELINNEGAIVRMPIRGREGLVEVNSKKLPGTISAAVPADVNPSDYDLIGLAMQEPQYRSPGVRELLDAVAKSKVPCMSIMNMPPLPFIARIPDIDASLLRSCYADASVWDSFDPNTMTLCSPDPQAFRPPEEKVNVLQVRLPTNFKCAPFADEASTQMIRDLENDILAARLDVDGEQLELPVKLRSHDSIYVPLAKWAMLLAGNYRCVLKDSVRPIKEAVHSDIDASSRIYEWVMDVCVALGADRADLVPFQKYADAAESLGSPSSAARALAAGATHIERVDRVVQLLAKQKGMQLAEVDEIVATVDGWLEANRKKAA